MDKLKRSERMIVITERLLNNPFRIFTLGSFADEFQSAKSSISEDLVIIREVFLKTGFGYLETLPGAAGGVIFTPCLSDGKEKDILARIAEMLSSPDRILPGGYLYMNDIIYNPQIAEEIGKVFLKRFAGKRPDYVVTAETKGIPIALMTAKFFSVPLVTIRSDSRVTEGSSVSINYVAGSSKKIGTMTLSRRSLPAGSKVILIDDFMKAGGTARGMKDLMSEFQAEVLGFGVLVGTAEPEEKLISDYFCLLELRELDEEGRKVAVEPVF